MCSWMTESFCCGPAKLYLFAGVNIELFYKNPRSCHALDDAKNLWDKLGAKYDEPNRTVLMEMLEL